MGVSWSEKYQLIIKLSIVAMHLDFIESIIREEFPEHSEKELVSVESKKFENMLRKKNNVITKSNIDRGGHRETKREGGLQPDLKSRIHT